MTQSYLLDTNFVSELKRPNPSHRVLNFLTISNLDHLYISTINLVEIRFGIETSNDPLRSAELEVWLEGELRPMFEGRILEVTEEIMLRWRFLIEKGRKAGRTYSQPDLIIAAMALEHDMVLVTRNIKDFVGMDMKLLNPWDA